jgi:hypothetical protein
MFDEFQSGSVLSVMEKTSELPMVMKIGRKSDKSISRNINGGRFVCFMVVLKKLG